MKTILTLFAFSALLCSQTHAAERRVISLDGEWQLGVSSLNVRPAVFDRTVPVPGTLIEARPELAAYQPRSVEGLVGKKAEKISENERALWHRRTFTLDGSLPEVAWLTVNKSRWGVKAWVNGHEVGEHHRIRTAAGFDVREHLKGNGAENEIVLRLGATQNEVPVGIPAFSSWTGNVPGLYDSVSLTLCDSPHMLRVQAVPDLAKSRATLAVTLKNSGNDATEANVSARIVEDESGREVGVVPPAKISLAGASETSVDLIAELPQARLWSSSQPFLYRFEIEVRAGNTVTDTHSDRFGMRSFRIDPKTGRGLLNGLPILLRGAGVLNVVDFLEDPACGRKPWTEDWVRRALQNIKDMNGNAARFAFDHPPELWYRLADEVGILIQDEAHSGMGGNGSIVETLAAEFTDWIHERANHPSVVIWDASNETSAQIQQRKMNRSIAQVRHLDRSNRPWDNSWDPTGVPGDVSFEPHPYLGWRAQYSQSSFPINAKKGDWPGVHQDVALETLKPGFIINEYCGVMLQADGTPSKYAKTFFDAFLAPETTVADRFHIRARFSAMESEYWRRVPGVCGVMINPYLHGSGRSFMKDPEKPEIDPLFLRFLRDAYAPVSVMVDHWATKVAPGKPLTVPVSIANDGKKPWSGEVRLRLLRATGPNLSKTSALFTAPADDAALKAATLASWQHTLGPIALTAQQSHTFTVAVPAEPGNFHLVAEITGEDGTPVRSWRDFKTTKIDQ